MIKQNKLLVFSSVLTTVLLGLFSCNKIWNEHYDGSPEDLPGYNLGEYIDSRDDLNVFSQMLKISGFDSILNASQTFTVWVPTDQALSGVDLDDLSGVDRVVRNHIARGNISTSGIHSSRVKMINGKNVYFETGIDNGYLFGGKSIIEKNLLADNGQIHIINDYVPYVDNILEYINLTSGFDSLSLYLKEQDTLVFDPVRSIEVGIDSNRNVIYDSVFISSNVVLDRIGALGNEDSLYTAILPDNTAWTEAYGRAESYYRMFEDYGGSKRMQSLARLAVVKDMVFREQVEDPGLFSVLESTGGNIFTSPSTLFNIETQVELSNGFIFSTSQMPYSDTASWFKPIIVEAEDPEGRENSNNNIIRRTGLGADFFVSGDNYILVDPTSTSNSSKSHVRFQIPNTLSATYKIYCVFIPAIITDPDNLKPTKAYFRLSYMTSSGTIRAKIMNPVLEFTNPFAVTKMEVGEITFDYANIIEDNYKDVTVRLQVLNDVTIEEENNGLYDRAMRIDYILLEPVLQ